MLLLSVDRKVAYLLKGQTRACQEGRKVTHEEAKRGASSR